MRLPAAGTIEIAPSLLSADFSRIAEELKIVEDLGLTIVHLDIMDGHFVPNLTFGPPVVAKLRPCSNLVFDAHLMITQPDQYIDAFIKAGADHITFHIETDVDHPDLIRRIQGAGCTAGISLNPDTPISTIKAVSSLCDMILVMTVHPGFGGQKLIDHAAAKVADVRALVGPDVRVQVDGGIDPTTAARVVQEGADTLVAGHAIFGQPDRQGALNAIRRAIP